MLDFRLKAFEIFRAKPDADLGRRPQRHRLREHLLLPEAGRAERALVGRRARGHQEHVRAARHPRGRAQVPGRRRRAVRVRGRLPQPQEGPRGQGVIFLDMDQALLRAPGAVPRSTWRRHPADRQQVRGAELGRLVGRLVHLRAAGREGRAAAAGLLPHQRGEHGPVRADADHRRRGRLRALRRGLHRADVLDRLAALGGGRDHRQAARPLPLHDDPELVEQRLQPRHQARRGRRGRDHGVGRRQPRLQGHDEVPGRAPDGRGRARRDPLDRLRGRGPAPGRRRQGHARGARHDQRDHLEVDLQGRRPLVVPRPAARQPQRRALALEGRLRRADPRSRVAHRHVPVHRHRRGQRRHRPRGDGLEDRRGAALLPA